LPPREVAAEVSGTFTYTGDQPFQGRIQVTALGNPQSRYLRLCFDCPVKPDECRNPGKCDMAIINMKFNDERCDASAFATYFDTNNPRDALKILAEGGVEAGCPAWRKSIYSGEDEHAVTQAIVTDLQGTEGRAWFAHGPECDLKRAPNWIVAKGFLCKGKMGRIGVLVKSFTHESEVLAPKPEDVEEAKKVLKSNFDSADDTLEGSGVWKIAEALKRRSQLKGPEITKGYISDLHTVASPTWVKTLEGPAELGATTCELGTTTTAKSLRLRMFFAWLGSGKYVTGRNTEAGLTAGAEKVEGIGWVLKKGLLPSMDLSWAVIDNMHPHLLDKQIESRRNGIVQLSSMRNAELWSRCRLKLLNNPTHPFDESMYKCTLLKVYDSKFIARFVFALFTYGASTEERYDNKIVQPETNDEKLLEAAKLVLKWNLSHETTFTVPEDLWPVIIEKGKKLEEKYGCEDVPLLLRSTPYKLSLIAYSFALLEGVEPTERHVNLAYKWLDYCAHDIELDEYANWWRSQHQLKDEELIIFEDTIESEITNDIKEHGGGVDETYTFKLIEYLAKNEKSQRDELAAYLNVDPKTVSKKANLLKGLGLLRSDMEGYHFTAKGVRFLKQWLAWISPFTSHSLSSPNSPAFWAKGVFERLLSKYEKYPLVYSSRVIQVIFRKIEEEEKLKDLLNTDPYAERLYNTLFPFTPFNPKTGVTKGAKGINILKDVKDWCYANRNESGEISLNDLTVFISKELKQEPTTVIEQAFNQGILMPSPKLGMAVVV